MEFDKDNSNFILDDKDLMRLQVYGQEPFPTTVPLTDADLLLAKIDDRMTAVDDADPFDYPAVQGYGAQMRRHQEYERVQLRGLRLFVTDTMGVLTVQGVEEFLRSQGQEEG